jgi:hypothetical protein
MSLRTRLTLVGGYFLLAGLFGCSTLADLGIAVPYVGDPPVTPIDLLDGKPRGALVYLRGVVGDTAPFLTGGAYLLKDASGSIWIRTDSPRLPKKGEEIVIQGKLDSESVPKGIQAGDEIYVRELQQMDAVATNSTAFPPVEPKPAPVSEVKPSPVPENQPVTTVKPSPAPEGKPAVITEVKPSPVTETKPAPTVETPRVSAVAEMIPPKPPAVSKPAIDPLDAFFLPHKQGRK